MQTYDIILLTVLIATTITGAVKGFVWQVASLASLIASYLIAYRYGAPVASLLPLKSPWGMIIGMMLLFFATGAVIWVVCQLIREWLDRVKLTAFDRQIGAILGLAKGAVFCVIITAISVTFLGPTVRAEVARSQSGYFVGRLLDRSERLFPDEINEILKPYLDAVDQHLEQGEETGDSDHETSSEALPGGMPTLFP